MWAHRGASRRAPENTAPAFALARELGADGVECDVMLCGTGELVVCHDPGLERLCGLPLAVRDTPLAALAGLAVLDGRFPGLRAGIPTLEEAVAAGGDALLWNVELKVDDHRDAEPIARAAAREIRRLGLPGRVLVSSFHPHALLTFRRAAPGIPTGYLFERPDPRLWHAFWWRVAADFAVHPEASLATRRNVARWHAAGRAVNVWTVDDPADMRRLARGGVQGIITNVPDVALQVLA